MPRFSDDPLLQTTRGVLYLILTILIVAGTVLAIASAALPLWWSEALAELGKENPGARTDGLLPELLALFATLIVVIGLVWTALRKLLAIVRSVGDGDAFIAANAYRLRAIGWLLVATQLVGIPLALLASHIADRFGDNDVDFDISVSGLLSILLTFVLARVFERGAAMREEMEGTV